MDLIVQKFGGTSVANAERVEHVADLITRTYDKGNNVLAVVSAQGKFTDVLVDKANEINPKGSRREMDVLLSAGEQISIALLALAIEKRGYPVKSMLGWQAGFVTDSNHSNARIRRINTERVQNELAKRTIIIVAGFQGLDRYDDMTTLGRGGSDTSAVALAAALNAKKCQIYTDVDGVYTADPRIVKGAKKLDSISYDEMLELATLGAQVLHNRSVEMAKRYNVDLEVLSSLEDKPGTIIKEEANVEKMIISGVAKDTNVARISLLELKDQPGMAFRIFSLLAKEKINVDIILQSVGRDGTKDITFTVAKENADHAVEILSKSKEQIGCKAVLCDKEVAKVSIVGAGMESNPGVACKLFDALAQANINIDMVSTSEIKISVLIHIDDAQRAVAAIHDKFYND
ncbi:MAG: aspartate kinase [Oscillospiraceae bacterium]|nr:aspartate kinase [Oscillospiraceae bacterium]MCM0704231.1 aspartate kinase [Faecalicatena sp. BF-R-105]MDY3218592.1 aspartate kinase [Candidatus Fimivivens sp.]SFJ03994.1 aspartate kinase [Ruminococcaceae bacterium D5]GKH50749.1 aspartokinase [Eubacteriales bacterium]